MAIDGEEIRDAFEKPRDTYLAPSGVVCKTRGRITLVIGDANAIITILWARVSDWKADVERGGYGERDADLSKARKAVKARRRGA